MLLSCLSCYKPTMSPEEDFPSRLQVFYQDCVDNIRFLKQQQWRATNYALLVYAAAYFVRKETPLHTCYGKAALTAILVVTFGINVWLLIDNYRSLSRFRSRIDWIYRNKFPSYEQTKTALDLVPKTEDPWFIWLLGFVSIVGAALVGVIIWLGGDGEGLHCLKSSTLNFLSHSLGA
jgi:hypothetical protein